MTGFSIGGHLVAAGERATIDLPVSALSNHTKVAIPIHVLHGAAPGPTMFLSGAIHGDEIQGVEIIRRILLHPALGNLPATRPDETQPWTLCITNTPTQYLYTSDEEPGRIYKMTLDGKILGTLGQSGRGPKQFNWIHGLACATENDLLVADMNNWRVQKLTLHPERMTSTPAAR